MKPQSTTQTMEKIFRCPVEVKQVVISYNLILSSSAYRRLVDPLCPVPHFSYFASPARRWLFPTLLVLSCVSLVPQESADCLKDVISGP